MADERVCMEGYNAKQKWLLLVKGIIVGFGAIMPGISGGTLCVAFGTVSYTHLRAHET